MGVNMGRVMDMKLEVMIVPVADVDRAKRFYEQLGWRLDAISRADRIPGRAIHASGFGGVDPVRKGRHQPSRRGRSRVCTSWCPTSRRRAPSW